MTRHGRASGLARSSFSGILAEMSAGLRHVALTSWLAIGLLTAGDTAQAQREARDRVTVLLFTAVDCPISDRYAPELTRLAAGYRDRVQFTLVYPNHGDPDGAIDAHARAFGFPMPHRRDIDGSLTARAGVTVTPEVAVFAGDGRLVYRGRIDDRYSDFGVDRPTPTRRDLAVALDELLAGRPVSVPETRAIGCAIVRQP